MTAGFRIAVFVFAFAISSAGVRADIVYSNLGPSPGYDPARSYGQSDQSYVWMAFQIDAAARLTSITLPAQAPPHAPLSGVLLSLYPSVSTPYIPGLPPHHQVEPLEQWFIRFQSAVSPGSVTWVTAQSSARPLLAANTAYLLEIHSGGPTDSVWWPMNNTGALGLVGFANVEPPGTLFTTLAAFQLEGDVAPVPEPGTLLLLATGAALGARRLRRK